MKLAFCIIASSIGLFAQTPSYYLAPNPVQIGPTGGAAQPFVCQTQTCATANSSSEVLYIKATGTGGCSAMYSMGFNSGANQTNLSAIYTSFPSYLTYNASTPRYSPDGQWIIVASNGQSARVCTVTQAKPGAGFGYSLWACRVSNTTCYELNIEGDNTAWSGNGNVTHCAAGVACPVNPAVLTNWVDDVHGVLHWYFTPDQTKIYGMYVMGATMATPERLNGTARWANITLPPSGAPTLSNVTETDVPPLGDGTGSFNWYEGAGAMPLSIEPSTCTLFFTSINNASGSFNNTSILKYNICTQAYAYLPPSTAYQEHWNIRTQGDIGIGIDATYLPVTLPFCLCGGVSGPTDLSYGPATVGKTTQLTFYNDLRPLGNPITSMSDPGWDWTGNYVVAEYVLADNTTHVASSGYILKYSLLNTPPPAVQVSAGTLSNVTLQ